jgi:hypothetical protein
MPAGRTYTPIATRLLTSDAASIEFTSISGSYTDLVILGLTRSTRTAGVGALGIRFNSNSSSLYSSTRMYTITGSGTAGSDRNSGTYLEAGQIASYNYGLSVFTTCKININNYSNTTTFKTVLCNTPNSQDSAGYQPMVGLWRSTSAITTITMYDAYGGDFAAGTRITIYGISAA